MLHYLRINDLSTYYNTEAVPGKTLIIFDEIDRSIRKGAFYENFILKCLEGLSQRIRLALEDGDPCGWMNPEVIGSILDADMIRRCCSE